MGLLGITTNLEAVDSILIANSRFQKRPATLKASCGALKRGTVLEMVSAGSGQWQQLQAGSPANARAILFQTVEDSAAVQVAQILTLGKVREKDLIWPDGITTQNKLTALQNLEDRGISIDEEWLAVSTTTTTTSSSTTTTTTTTTAP